MSFLKPAGFFFLLPLFTVLVACSPPPQGESSILLITVGNFRADDLGCSSSRDSFTPKLDEICNESVRFTHAYTPSVLIDPAMASILTGLYPAESGVHRNDAGRYLDGVKTVPRFAHEQGLESIFVSGGVPVLRKSAVSRGFDYFDDSVRVGGSFYRPADEVVKRFLFLLQQRSPGSPFFGVLHFSDLQFPEILSLKANQNEKREGQEIGKLQEIDEAIGSLREEFQRLRIWDKMTVVVAGLQGTERSEHNGLSKGINLYDEITHVPLLVKPSRKPSDHPPSWKVDAAVSLVDVGATFFKILGSGEFPKSKLPFHDLTDTLEARGVEPKEQPVFCESDLPPWRQWGPRLVGMRVGEWSLMMVPETKLFNTYTDRAETHDFQPGESMIFRQLEKTWQEFRSQMTTPFEKGKYFLPVSVAEKLRVAKIIFSPETKTIDRLKELEVLRLRRPDDWQISQWQMQALLDQQDWLAMRRLLKLLKPSDGDAQRELELWKTFVSLKTKLDHYENQTDVDSECLYLSIALKRFNISELDQYQARHQCVDPEIHSWFTSYLNNKLKRPREAASFFDTARVLTDKRVEQTDFAKQFWIDGATWDYKASLPSGPSKFEFFMALVSNPEFVAYVKKK